MSEQATDFDRDGMTFWGDSISAQVRHDTSGEYLVIYALDEAELDVDNAVILRGDDVQKLAALIAEAESRALQRSKVESVFVGLRRALSDLRYKTRG